MERILGQVGPRPSRARRTVLRSNGIKRRHYAIDPDTLQANFSNASMTAQAVRQLNGRQIDLAAVDCLSCGTSIPDQMIPNHASMVQGELEMSCCEAVATAGVCASGMTALKYAYMAVLCGQSQAAIATGSDLSSGVIRASNFTAEIDSRVKASVERLERQPELAFEKDFLRWMLSDGAGAMLLQGEPASSGLPLRIDGLDIFSYAGEMETCMYAGANKTKDGQLHGWQSFDGQQRLADSLMAIKQDVKLLNDNIMHYTVEKPLLALQEKYRVRAGDFDWFVPHYSSNFFRDKVLASMETADFVIPQQQWFTNLTEKGNTGAASIYIMLEELFHSGQLKNGQRLLCYIPESGRFSSTLLQLSVI